MRSFNQSEAVLQCRCVANNDVHPPEKKILYHRGGDMYRTMAVMVMLVVMSMNAYGKIHSWKGGVHLALVPIIEGTGIYTDVEILRNAEQNGTKAGAVTNLGLLAVQAGLGSTILFGSDELPKAIRFIHRIVGMGIIGTGLWLSIEGSIDKGVPSSAHYTAYAHTAFATAPLILLTF